MRRSLIYGPCALLLTFASTYDVNADTINFISTQKPANENPATVLAAAQIVLGDPGLIDAFRAEPQSSLNGTNSFGTFSVMRIPNATTGATAIVTFSLNPGFVLAGVFAFGGNRGGNFYSVNDETAGSFEVNAPLAGKSGKFADLSHLDFFVERGSASVPDGGITLMMLGGTFVGLIGLRRYFMNAEWGHF